MDTLRGLDPRMQRRRSESVPAIVKAYDTPASALRGAEQENLTWVARTGIKSCFSQTIENALWADDSVHIELASGDVVGIGCGEYGVICERVGQAVSAFKERGRESSAIELLFKDDGLVWDREQLIGKLPGKTLSSMSMSGNCLFLYVSGLPIICFGVLRDRDTGQLFLFWSESD